MNTFHKSLYSLLMLLIVAIALNLAHAQDPESWEETDTILVGRLSYIEGELSRYDPDARDWSATVVEAPIGVDDLMRTEADSRAEFIFPNNTWARIDSQARIQLVALDTRLTHADVSIGTARFYNKSTHSEIKATTPFGLVMAPPGAVFDLRVGEDGVDIIAIRKHVNFIHNKSQEGLEVRSGAPALFADMLHVSAEAGDIDADWVAWNHDMDALWADRMRTEGDSTTYLPEELQSEAYALDRHGVWERVYYDGAYYRFWRPVQISVGWTPFSWGAWIVWHGDHVWVPHEPFGYVTHHYGNWIFTAGFWYWAPPVTRVTILAHHSLLRIGFGWYPGRVAWLHFGAHVGWIPLAPFEPYYAHRHWGRRSIVLTKHTSIRHPNAFRYHDHAVVIHRNHLYRSADYRQARVKSFTAGAIRTKFHTTPVMDQRVVKDYRTLRNRDRFKMSHPIKRHHTIGGGSERLGPNAYAAKRHQGRGSAEARRMAAAEERQKDRQVRSVKIPKARPQERSAKSTGEDESKWYRQQAKVKAQLQTEAGNTSQRTAPIRKKTSFENRRNKPAYDPSTAPQRHRRLVDPSESRLPRPRFENQPQYSHRRSNIAPHKPSAVRTAPPQKRELPKITSERRAPASSRQWQETQQRPEYKSQSPRGRFREDAPSAGFSGSRGRQRNRGRN